MPDTTAMNETSNEPQIGIIAHVGNDNLGDEATVAALIQNLRRRLPRVGIVAFTSRPEHTREFHGIPAFRLRRLNADNAPKDAVESNTKESTSPSSPSFAEKLKGVLKKIPIVFRFLKTIQTAGHHSVSALAEARFLIHSFQHVRGLRLVVVAGSQQLNDYVDGPWAFAYTVFKWTVLARLAGAKVAFASVGAGPVDTRLGRLFVTKALALGSHRGFRDAHAQECAKRIGFRGPSLVVPDLVYSLSLPDTLPRARGSRPLVGINPLPMYDPRYWYIPNAERYRRYLITMADFTLGLIQRGYDIILFPTQLKADPLVIDDLMAEIHARSTPDALARIGIPVCRSFPDVISVIRSSDIVVPTRYHGVLFSILCRKPTLAISYQPKTPALMGLVGQEAFDVNVDFMDPQTLEERFAALETVAANVPAQLEQHIAYWQAEVEQQYDRILALLPPAMLEQSPLRTSGALPATEPHGSSRMGGF
jgi:polysaccharide pyruvyl transferase WcaK-like protein